MPERWTKPRNLAFVGLFLGSAAMAGPLDEPHLNIVPRSETEAARIPAVTALATRFDEAQPFEAKSAGAATVRAMSDANAFSQPSGNITFEDQLNFKVGNGLFRKLWVSSPSSTLASDGLGPLYNARSCQRCHIKDGRGHPPEGPGDNSISMFLRVSIPTEHDDASAEIEGYLATLPEPTYGTQMQDFSLAGHPAEYRLRIDYEQIELPLSGGEIAYLRKPTYTAADLGYGPLHPDAMLSPRVAPQMIGLGLLESIPAADILALADPDDADDDGISGRPNIVWSVEFDQTMLGRFGLKAGAPTVRHQSAGAFAGDIGISSPLFPAAWGECTEAQTDCRDGPHGDRDDRAFEIDAEGLDLVTFYSRNLGVPARRDVDDADVLRGKEVFYTTGCTSCHQPSFVTHRLEVSLNRAFSLSGPIRICCCMTWGRAWPIADPRHARPAQNGGRRRFGALALPNRCPVIHISCMMGEHGPCSRPSCGTVARPRPSGMQWWTWFPKTA